ncbi:hypothetical protein HDU76_013863 [Blyttiomyces sp. JEL0837]|nr:hypothetical protein HDU76_013863 [Blyttiomyces sp. JEL0837]
MKKNKMEKQEKQENDIMNSSPTATPNIDSTNHISQLQENGTSTPKPSPVTKLPQVEHESPTPSTDPTSNNALPANLKQIQTSTVHDPSIDYLNNSNPTTTENSISITNLEIEDPFEKVQQETEKTSKAIERSADVAVAVEKRIEFSELLMEHEIQIQVQHPAKALLVQEQNGVSDISKSSEMLLETPEQSTSASDDVLVVVNQVPTPPRHEEEHHHYCQCVIV